MTSQLSNASSSLSSSSPSLNERSFSLPLPFKNNLLDADPSRPLEKDENAPSDVVLLPKAPGNFKCPKESEIVDDAGPREWYGRDVGDDGRSGDSGDNGLELA